MCAGKRQCPPSVPSAAGVRARGRGQGERERRKGQGARGKGEGKGKGERRKGRGKGKGKGKGEREGRGHGDNGRSPDVSGIMDPMPSAPKAGRERAAGLARRWLLAGAGVVAVGLGGLGVFVPGLPTTIFLIIASYCFARSCRGSKNGSCAFHCLRRT